jgi:hypothetical protein
MLFLIYSQILLLRMDASLFVLYPKLPQIFKQNFSPCNETHEYLGPIKKCIIVQYECILQPSTEQTV